MARRNVGLNRVSLYEQVATRLQRDIRAKNQPGDRLPAEAQLAKDMGVSSITLREALSIVANRGVIERRHGSGTYVLDPTAGQWVAIVTHLDLSHPNLSFFHRRVAFLLRALISEAGLKVRIYSGSARGWIGGDPSTELPEALFEDLEGELIRAVVSITSDEGHLEKLRKFRIPLVGTSPEFAHSALLPHGRLVPAGVEAMASQGCRTASIISGPVGEHERAQWVDVLGRHGMTTRPEWIACMNSLGEPATGWNAFLSVWRSCQEKPDCVIVTDDIVFRDVSMAILHERIDVPRTLKVFTHYNKGSGNLIPFKCTLFEVDADAFATELSNLVLMVLSPRAPKSNHVEMQCRIVGCDAPP
jgi:DNA-binding LacI/PurR family transcriptional regulator